MERLRSIVKSYGFIVHPILFAVFPLVSFYGANTDEIAAGDFSIGSFLLLSLTVVCGSWVVSRFLTKSSSKASLLTLGVLIVFFTFGRVHSLIPGFALETPLLAIGPTKTLLFVSLMFVVVCWFLLTKISEKSAIKANYNLAFISTAMILIAVIPILGNVISNADFTEVSQSESSDNSRSKDTRKTKPDVYYVLLDGYTRGDYLKENFDYDNSEFLTELEKKGFYIAEEANSNYAHSHFSIPSTFNMKYLNYLTEEVGENSTDRLPLRDLIVDNEATSKFKSLGYSYVNHPTAWGWTEALNKKADLEVDSDIAERKIFNIKLDEFALVYLQTTILKLWVSTDIVDGLAAEILGAFEKTEKVPEFEEPTFTFAHILSPHPPYLFDRNGKVLESTELELDVQGYSNREGYVEQTEYINKLTLDMVDSILANSEEPPIIIVASDHGSAASLTRSDFEKTNVESMNKDGVKERMGILNTFYFPDQDYSNLYQEITPANNFRVILKQYFDEDIELLPDKSYFSDNKKNEYRMIDVTELVN